VLSYVNATNVDMTRFLALFYFWSLCIRYTTA